MNAQHDGHQCSPHSQSGQPHPESITVDGITYAISHKREDGQHTWTLHPRTEYYQYKVYKAFITVTSGLNARGQLAPAFNFMQVVHPQGVKFFSDQVKEAFLAHVKSKYQAT